MMSIYNSHSRLFLFVACFVFFPYKIENWDIKLPEVVFPKQYWNSFIFYSQVKMIINNFMMSLYQLN